MRRALRLVLATIRSAARSRRDLTLENLALRHQLAMCSRRPRVRNADRALWAQLLRRWSGWESALVVLEPATIVRWHRRLAALLDVEEQAAPTGSTWHPAGGT
jgi:hypothetical protein